MFFLCLLLFVVVIGSLCFFLCFFDFFVVMIGSLCFFFVVPDAASSKHKPVRLDLDSSKVRAGPTEFLLRAQARAEKMCSKHGLLLGQSHETPAARLVMGMIQASPFRFLEARRELNEGECVEGGLARASEVQAGSGR